jgi:hypothetical protein
MKQHVIGVAAARRELTRLERLLTLAREGQFKKVEAELAFEVADQRQRLRDLTGGDEDDWRH